jgi:hypothetical protein
MRKRPESTWRVHHIDFGNINILDEDMRVYGSVTIGFSDQIDRNIIDSCGITVDCQIAYDPTATLRDIENGLLREGVRVASAAIEKMSCGDVTVIRDEAVGTRAAEAAILEGHSNSRH